MRKLKEVLKKADKAIIGAKIAVETRSENILTNKEKGISTIVEVLAIVAVVIALLIVLKPQLKTWLSNTVNTLQTNTNSLFTNS